MKLVKIAFIGISLLSLCSCVDKEKQQTTSGKTVVDYSSCAYIGTGSHYYVTAGSGDSLQTMHFFFDPDGIGAWGTTKKVNGKEVKEIYEYVYTLTGGVNVSWKEIDSKETGKGFFTTDSTGQVFVCEGIHFYRYS